MNTPDALVQVAEFHRTFHHPILNSPQIPPLERAKLRISLLSEELKEFQEAVENQDIVEAADALCDLQYVLMGAVLEFGLGESFEELFNEVQRSNMSKACQNESEAKETVAFYEAKGTPCYYIADGDRFLVYRTEDQKTLKNVHYSPADLVSVVNKFRK
ncbi:MAG: hypothetical protein ACK4LB_14205 [Spirosomataceae bacterium]